MKVRISLEGTLHAEGLFEVLNKFRCGKEPTAALFYSWSIRYIVNRAPVTDITSYFSPLSVYCGDKDVAPDVSDLRSTSDDCGSAACSIFGQDSGNEETTDAGSSFLLKGNLYGRSFSPYMLTSRPQMTYKCVIHFQLQSTTCTDMCLILT